MHFADLAQPLTDAERAILDALLTYGPRLPAATDAAAGAAVLVVPRAGTISPWSSKATDIAQVCGLGGVRRLERGIEYRLHARAALGARELARLAPVLFDRMTEMALLDAADAARLFEHAAPQPLQVRVAAPAGAPRSRPRIASSGWRCRPTRSTTSSRISRAWDAIRPTSN